MKKITQTAQRIVILGGGYAGWMTATRLARKSRGTGATITLINGQDHFVERIRLHQLAANQKLTKRLFRDVLNGTGVQFVQGWVTALSPNEHSVTFETPDDATQSLTYDYLVYALGSTIETESVPGCEENALTLGTEQTALALQQRLPQLAKSGGRLVIGGAGLTGIEAATEIAEAYPTIKITMITNDEFGSTLSQKGRRYIRQILTNYHVEIMDNCEVVRIDPDKVQLADGSTVPADLTLWLGGFKVSDLARQAGLAVNERGQVIVDKYLCSVSHDHIYAIGDSASLEQVYNWPVRMCCAAAMPMGRYAATQLSATLKSRRAKPFWLMFGGRCISLGRHNAILQVVTPDDKPVEAIVTGRLGAQIKETICRATVQFVELERWLPGGARWNPVRSAQPEPLVEAFLVR
jgi:NADH:ubiquinone reductase (H+-translocating)